MDSRKGTKLHRWRLPVFDRAALFICNLCDLERTPGHRIGCSGKHRLRQFYRWPRGSWSAVNPAPSCPGSPVLDAIHPTAKETSK